MFGFISESRWLAEPETARAATGRADRLIPHKPETQVTTHARKRVVRLDLESRTIRAAAQSDLQVTPDATV
ncbi:MAG: hypothetical protein JWM63_2383 [Gammaproteobacteria bacterium]|jgi:hypothetical protein|nr:hypothetical protein [Gammaproteobacteria bacterium]